MNTELLNSTLDKCEREGCYGVLRITKNDVIIFERSLGYANAKTKEAFTKDSMFTLYSLSKPFCAIGLMKLYDRGLVDIDAHPGKYLREAVGFHKNLKIYQLLNHTSGIPDFVQTDAFYEKYRESTVSEVSGTINNSYLQSQGTPGTVSYGMVVDLTVAYYRENPRS